jgi:hypothetical protein
MRASIFAMVARASLNVAPRHAWAIGWMYFQQTSGRARSIPPESATSIGMPSSVVSRS